MSSARQAAGVEVPSHVRVGIRRYAITLDATAADVGRFRGRAEHQDHYRILLDPALLAPGREAEAAEVVLHELIHCVLGEAGYDEIKNAAEAAGRALVDDEWLVYVLGVGLTRVMLDNPTLAAWLAYCWSCGPAGSFGEGT